MWLYVVYVYVSDVPDKQVCGFMLSMCMCPVYLIGRYVDVCCLCVCVSGVSDRQVCGCMLSMCMCVRCT